VKDQLLRLEMLARKLDPDQQGRAGMTRAAISFADAFLASMPERGTYQRGNVEPDPAVFSLQEDPVSMDQALAIFEHSVLGSGINPASGSHFGYIPGGGVYPSALGDFLADVTNRYSGVFFASPGAALMERSLVQWMATGLVGLPAGAGGDLTSGGSMANLSAIVTAREACAIRARDVERSVVYLSAQTHHCVDKALRIAGLGECIIRRVELDAGWRMNPEALAKQVTADRAAGLRPWLVVASAGTTDVGAVDPLDAIADVAAEHGLWNHVDAAYGGFFLLTRQGRQRLAGIQRADTVVLDPHKGLFLPFGTGTVLARDESLLAAAHHYTANYMQDARESGGRFSPADLGPELTRPFRGMRLWLPLKLFGLEPFRAALEEKLLLARYFREQLTRIPGFEVGPEPDLSVVTYRYRPQHGDADDCNRRLLQAVHADGHSFISSTRIGDRFLLRFACLHMRSHLQQVDQLLEFLSRESARL
jgi:glutamate/tyrosine decarboxylase-like PLP-dependent enzyme